MLFQEEDYRVIDQQLYVSFRFLRVMGVPEKTIINGLSKNTTDQSKSWIFFALEASYKAAFIDFNSIPFSTKRKYKIPEKDAIIGDRALEKAMKISDAKRKKLSLARLGITHAYNSKWENYAPLYFLHVKFPKDKIKYLAQTHAAIEEIIQLKKNGYMMKDLFTIYMELPDVVFKCSCLNTFYRKLTEAKETGIRDTIINKAMGRKKENIKLSKLHKLRIKELYRNPKKFSYDYITNKINLEMLSKGFNPISLSTVKRFLKDPEIQNECKNFQEWR